MVRLTIQERMLMPRKRPHTTLRSFSLLAKSFAQMSTSIETVRN